MNFSRRQFIKVGSGATLATSAGCSRLPEGWQVWKPRSTRAPGPFQPPAAESIDLVSHALNRLTFGARPGDYARVKTLGTDDATSFHAFVEEQLHPEIINDEVTKYALRRFDTLNQPLGELFEYKERVLLDEMTRATLLRATISERQLYEVMVQFWTDHFNIDPSKGDCRWLKATDDREVIRQHALGKFPEMLRASALSPAMLWYLDGRENRKARPEDKPNENYGRELLELHTLGVHGGYSQRDVMEVARCLTGWTVRDKKNFQKAKVEFKPYWHDQGRKEVLGHVIPAIPANANADQRQELGEAELDRVLEIVSLHEATARHLATKLCRRFIADTPPEPAIAAVAGAFLLTKGDIPNTLRALFATPEFQNTRGNKFKRPFNFIVSALRATNAVTDARHELVEYLLRMGHAPFHYPTPDGYPEEASPWLGTLLWRWNFAVTLSENRFNGAQVNFESLKENLGGDAGLMAHLLGRTPTAEEIQSYHESGAGLALMLASPAFQRC